MTFIVSFAFWGGKESTARFVFPPIQLLLRSQAVNTAAETNSVVAGHHPSAPRAEPPRSRALDKSVRSRSEEDHMLLEKRALPIAWATSGAIRHLYFFAPHVVLARKIAAAH